MFVDFFPPGARQLNFRFDLYNTLSYASFWLDPSFCKTVLDCRRTVLHNNTGVQLPAIEHDYAIRFMEFYEWMGRRPDKIKHWHFLARQTDFRFVEIVNRYTNLALRIDSRNGKLNLNIQMRKHSEIIP